MSTATAHALRLSALVMAICTAGPVAAQVQVPNVFQAGQTARAVEVNENFTALAEALAAALAAVGAMESRIGQLETELAQAQGALAALDELDARVAMLDDAVTLAQATLVEVPVLAGRVGSVELELQALAGSGPGEQLEILSSRLTLLEEDLAEVLSMAAYLTMEEANAVTGQPTIRFRGVNLQLDNGVGAAGAMARTGTGNLIIGFNTETPAGLAFLPARCPDGSADASTCPGAFRVNHRGGSHNLIIGEGHSYNGVGSIVSGFRNRSLGDSTATLGGQDNLATGQGAMVLGGERNWVTAEYGVIAGGDSNRVSGRYSAVFNGDSNDARSQRAVLLGGAGNRTQDPPGGFQAATKAVILGGELVRIDVESTGAIQLGGLNCAYPTLQPAHAFPGCSR